MSPFFKPMSRKERSLRLNRRGREGAGNDGPRRNGDSRIPRRVYDRLGLHFARGRRAGRRVEQRTVVADDEIHVAIAAHRRAGHRARERQSPARPLFVIAAISRWVAEFGITWSGRAGVVPPPPTICWK